jgi:hypothetical protein
MKNIWVSALGRDQEKVHKTMAMLKTYGLAADGHFWEDDVNKMAWLGPRNALIQKETSLWLILSNDKDLSAGTVRYGLSMLALSVQAVRGRGFPIILLHSGDMPAAETLPTPFQGAKILAAGSAAAGAKVVAAVHTPPKSLPGEYRLDVHAMPKLGQWFEAGPTEGCWEGAMFGICGGEIDAHGVGPAGKLPEKAVLEYPMKGLKLNLGETEYTAWAVRNRLDAGSSYYVRVQGEPRSILLGPMAEGDEAEVYVLNIG